MTKCELKILVFVMVLSTTGKSFCQHNAIVRNKLYPSGKIDTLFVLESRTYMCLKNNQEEYTAIPELNDTIRKRIDNALKTYFSTSHTQLPGAKPKPRDTKTVLFSSIEPSPTLQDSIFQFMYDLHTRKVNKVEVPDVLFGIMASNRLDHMMLVFQYGFLKDHGMWVRQEIGAAILSILARGANIPASRYHNEVTCCILDLKTRSIAYYGYVISGANPTDENGYVNAFMWMFDNYLSKKKLIGRR